MQLLFKDAVRLSARAAHVKGLITVDGLQAILSATNDPAKLAAIECSVYDHAVSQGVLTAGDGSTVAQVGVNWTGLLAFITALIPIIEQLINIFGG